MSPCPKVYVKSIFELKVRGSFNVLYEDGSQNYSLNGFWAIIKYIRKLCKHLPLTRDARQEHFANISLCNATLLLVYPQ